jgi:phosphoenolpyruvate carboxykinase (ATP)
MAIGHTRALLRAVLDGTLQNATFTPDPFFGLMVPRDVPGIPNDVLDPRQAWADKEAYDRTARDLVSRFEANFETFAAAASDHIKAAAIRTAA